MARYISRYAGDCRILRVERTELVLISGEKHPIVTIPPLIAQFRAGVESTYELQYAKAAFTGQLTHHPDGTVSFNDYLLSPFGAEMRLGGAFPTMYPGEIALPGMTQVMPIQAYDIAQKFSTFDTAWHYNPDEGIGDWSAEDAKEAELLLDRDAGADYFKVSKTRVRPPWPAYDEMREQQGAHNAIPAMIRNGGFNPAAVLAYEEQFDAPKAGVVKGIREMIDQDAQRASEDAGLTVVVS